MPQPPMRGRPGLETRQVVHPEQDPAEAHCWGPRTGLPPTSKVKDEVTRIEGHSLAGGCPAKITARRFTPRRQVVSWPPIALP